MKDIYPNDPCPCGSGKKYKKCCMKKNTVNPSLYIRQQLEAFDNDFVDAVVRAFDMIVTNREPDGCLSNSAALYVVARKYGYDAELCYGLCELDNKPFYHAWLEIDGTVIDLAIFGNVNYSQYSMWSFTLDKPFIGSYESSQVKYGKYKFDENWQESNIAMFAHKTLRKYMDALPNDNMWILVCQFLGIYPSSAEISKLKPYVSKIAFDKFPNIDK